jgi:putative CocE/NonD family hydrolase
MEREPDVSEDAAKTEGKPALAGSMDLLNRAGGATAPQIQRMPETSLRVMVEMRDGVRLDTYIWLPKGVERAPAIFSRTPYREDVLGWARLGLMRYVEEGYALVYQMVRGTGRSEGAFVFSAPHERNDGYDAIEWIAAQAWCDGKVGMDGGSYVGMTQLAAAATRPPHLLCMIPHVPSADFFREAPYFGGGFGRQHTINWLNLISIDSLAELTGGFMGVMPILAQPEWLARLTSRPVLDAADDVLKGDRLQYYRDALAHPTLDDWWKERSLSAADYAAMDIPTLVVSGNFDWSIGVMTVWDGLMANAADREDRQLLIGPWDHGQSYIGTTGRYGPFDLGEASLGDPYPIRLAFFDKHLKGKGAGPDLGGKVKVFVTGANAYRSFSAYPPVEMRPTDLFLASGGRANTYRGDGTLDAAPPSEAPADTMRADPALPFVPAMTSALGLQLDAREHVAHAETLVYATAPLDRPMTLVGEPQVQLYVSTDTPDADVVVNLCERRPDGMVAVLSHHMLRLRYREGFDREVLMTPGEVVEARIKLTNLCHQLQPGAQLVLTLRPDFFPFIDPNPNTGEPIATATRVQPATISILHDAARPSRLILPVLDAS